jgi:hypothetical protein
VSTARRSRSVHSKAVFVVTGIGLLSGVDLGRQP